MIVTYKKKGGGINTASDFTNWDEFSPYEFGFFPYGIIFPYKVFPYGMIFPYGLLIVVVVFFARRHQWSTSRAIMPS